MTRSITLLFAVLAMSSGVSAAEPASGEQRLFNGENLSGWTYFLVDSNTKMSDVWSVRDELLIRSLLVAPMLNDAKPGDRLIDIGTGAGIPGLVAKIAYPHLNVTLVDATRKKIDFLAAAISALDLSEASAIHAPESSAQPVYRLL